MTITEAKKDVKARLDKAGIAFDKLTAKTTSFSGFGYGSGLFVKVHGAKTTFGPHRKAMFEDVPKPSQGGYIIQWADSIC
jgi:hypothetical protein